MSWRLNSAAHPGAEVTRFLQSFRPKWTLDRLSKTGFALIVKGHGIAIGATPIAEDTDDGETGVGKLTHYSPNLRK